MAGRVSFLMVLAAAAVVAGCSSREEYVAGRIDDARAFAQVRDYERAHEVLDDALSCAEGEFDLLMEKADIYMRAHEFDEAAVWYARAAAARPSSWKALAGRWEAEFEAAPDDDSIGDRIRVEADMLLTAAPDSLFNLSSAVRAYQIVGLEDEIEDARTRLVALYPESELASDLIKEELDWIGVERDDQKRLEMADAFLDAHPVTEWRPRAMRLKLITLKRLDRCDDGLEVGRAWAAEYRDDPEVLNTIAAAFIS